MIVPDVNLLLYACVTGFPQHPTARAWWEDTLNARVEVGLAAPALFGFVRLSTNSRVFDSPMSVGDALGRVRGWLEREQVRFLVPGPEHLTIAFGLLEGLGTGGNLTTDVQLAALAIEHRGRVYSNDTDFGRFPGLEWVNPLAV